MAVLQARFCAVTLLQESKQGINADIGFDTHQYYQHHLRSTEDDCIFFCSLSFLPFDMTRASEIISDDIKLFNVLYMQIDPGLF